MAPDKNGNFEGRQYLGIYHHFTIAINTENIKMVFNDVKDMGTVSNINANEVLFFFVFFLTFGRI